ncbi:MAG: PilN domain-containing protein [Clostridium sp.]|uniref:PilN domain-containing protein n=1 Tax=Clostridium culturomicium TaxID=1499683 RepID=UPI00058BC735|nr:PilN domain-containing protein [Clostridium culturomicium]MDU4890503.1 PilN domain-containing protein [Clostridium sp.]MDU7084055.1 PilN domain-containing protein [Clostridium sp.]
MRDLNFFEVTQIKENDVLTKKAIGGGAAVMAVLIGVTAATNVIGIASTKKGIANIEAKINDTAFQEKYAESQSVSLEKDAYNRYNTALNDIYTLIEDRNKLNPNFLEEISFTIPKEVVFSSINFSGGVVSISAKATTREAIAEFQHNINEIDFIKKSHIGGIASDMGDTDEVFSFSITCELEEAYYNESK